MNPIPHTTSPVGAATPAAATTTTGEQLRRLRWAVRATLTLGVAASVAANVLHAQPNPISQIIAAWPPLALLLTVELISRVPHHRRSLGAIRIAATTVIAGIATWVSYWHLVGVAARYGETEHGAAYLLPISVDGLVIVASVSLVEITARIRAYAHTPPAPTPTAEPETVAAASSPSRPAPTTTAGIPAAHTPTLGAPVAASMPTKTDLPPAPDEGDGRRRHPLPDDTAHRGTRASDTGNEPPHTRPDGGDPHEDPTRDGPPTRPADATQTPPADNGGGDPADDVPADTAAAVAYWRRRDPHLHPAEIAARIGKSERTVRRHWPQSTNGASHVNGRLAGSLRH